MIRGAAIILAAALGLAVLGEPAVTRLTELFPPAAGDNAGVVTDVKEIRGVDAILAEKPLNAGEEKEWKRKYELREKIFSFRGEMDSFYASTVKEFIEAESHENRVYSPLNLYIALSMLAESTGGNTQEEILKLLGASDTKALRERVDTLWRFNYHEAQSEEVEAGYGKDDSALLLSNSMWLNNKLEYKDPVLKVLSESYHADSFRGEMGSDAMNTALQSWTNEKTGGLLSEHVKGMSMKEETVLELVSTIYFKGVWSDSFYEGATREETFHGYKKDEKAQMMHDSARGSFYKGKNFTALSRHISDMGSMVFFLPNEGSDPEKLFNDSEFTEYLSSGSLETNSGTYMINASIPKFKLDSKIDLKKGLEALGIKDALNKNRANFKPLTSFADEYPVWLEKADHAAVVEIDEKGVTGAAFTDFGAFGGTAMPEPVPEYDFVLDRPFVYAVVSGDSSLLFAGTCWDL